MSSFNLSIADLDTALNFAKSILADRSIKDEAKQIVFIVREGEVTIGASTNRGTVSIKVPASEVDLKGESWVFQAKYGSLVSILGAYAGLSVTEVAYVKFEDTEKVVRVLIHEEPLDEANIQFAQDAYFNIHKSVPPAKVLDKFSQERPEGTEELNMGTMSIYLNGLGPKLINDTSGSVSSEIHIVPDYVFARSSAVFYAFKNELPAVFNQVTLGYTYLESIKSLMKYAVDNEKDVQVGQVAQFLYFEADNVRLYLHPKESRLDYESIAGPIFKKNSEDKFENRGLGVVVNRSYYKDIMPRLLVGGSKMAEVRFTEDTMHIETEDFQQEIPIVNSKGDHTKIAFKASIPILVNSLIDAGDAFKEFDEIRFYFLQSKTGYVMYVMDSSGAWVTSLQVNASGK